MNYQESREYIDRITREIPSVLGLDHMRELMKRLGNPQDDLKCSCSRYQRQGICYCFFIFCFIRCGISCGKICFTYIVFIQGKNGSFRKQDRQG